MSVRNLSLVLLALFVSSAAFARAEDSIDLDEEHKGTTKDVTRRGEPKLTSDHVAIDLKAGQRIELSVKVLGDGRGAAILLWNSDGVPIASSAPPLEMRFGGRAIPLSSINKDNIGDAQHLVIMSKKTARVVIGEVPATGTYRIGVYSELTGAYTVVAKDLTRYGTWTRSRKN